MALQVTYEVVLGAAAELEAAAERLAGVLGASTPETHVVPSGSDAVSVTVAGRLNEAAITHTPVSMRGVEYMRAAARTLKQHAATFAAGDAEHAAEIAAAAAIHII
jgi:hypothetical protein